MLYVHMCCQFILCAECHVALGLALFIRTHKVSDSKMRFQGQIRLVVHVFVMVPAQMTCQVLSIQMIDEHQLVEEILLAEITPGVRQYFCLSVRTRISLLNMLPHMLDVVESLLSDEDEATFQTNFAESLLMLSLQMLLQSLNVVELVARIAIKDKAMHLS